MKVIGSRIKDIRRMFLYESSMIGFIGGTIGVGVSYGISYLLNTRSKILIGQHWDDGETKLSIVPFGLLF